MLAALQFVKSLAGCLEQQSQPPDKVARLQVELFGSLALTGLGHRTDRAVIAGLSGEHPRTVDPAAIDPLFERVSQTGELSWLGQHPISFDLTKDLQLHRSVFLPQHPNGLRCSAWDSAGHELLSREYFSIGGGFVLSADDMSSRAAESRQPSQDRPEDQMPFEFASAQQLLEICEREQLTIAEVVERNELCCRTPQELADGLDEIWSVMQECIEAGCHNEGVLPGGLEIRRRAPDIYRKLTDQPADSANPSGPSSGGSSNTTSDDPLNSLDWVSLFALAVNEQNAAGGRVVTAPTNGAAGIIPAVCAYYTRFLVAAEPAQTRRQGVHDFLKTAAAVGMLYKRNASLSAAEMGCQGEVGVACSMAAAGLAAVMGGTPQQIENAAEIGMEHNLGLTCDPVAGLVQVPCIERNTMGAVQAINAARLAVLYGDGKHRVSLDKVIETMRQTGLDMQSKYKETSLGGLAVNVTLC